MNDDDFSGIVRSGSQHSVSVSEHTGNAKTPKNVVVSHEEETEARKRAFEEKALAASNADKALAAALAEHTELRVSDNTTAANTQKAAANNEVLNRQGIAGEGAAKPNVQHISTDVLEANHQKVGTDKLQDNIQSVSNGKNMAANVQNISVDVIAANQQKLEGEKGIGTNKQDIPIDVIAANQQSVSHGNIATNTQKIAGEKAIETNRQGIPTDVIAPNVQDISSKPFTANNQAIAQDALGLNRQSLDNGPAAAANLQALPKDDVAANRQSLGQDGNAKNQQGIPADGTSSDDQKLTELGVQVNQQPLAASMAPNNQAIGSDAPTLNRQALPQNAPPGTNRQSVDNGKIESHFEALPSDQVVRKKVDFAAEAANLKTGTKPAAKPSDRPRAPLTAADQQEAKLKREKLMAEFHGRVAGIKNNVNALNDRLSNFEEKVHKEDANLIKGAPENFDTHRD